MHAQLRSILAWVLGTDSALYRQVMFSPRNHDLVEMEGSMLLRSFEEYALQACSQQSEGLKAQCTKHLAKPVIAREVQGWIDHVGVTMDDDVSYKQTICICVLVRDFDDIRRFVEQKWTQRIVVDNTAATVVGIQDGINLMQGLAQRVSTLQQQAKVIALNIPYLCNQAHSEPWDGRKETWKNAVWHETVRRVAMEARLVLCGEIIQHKHHASGAVRALHSFLTQIRGNLPYTANAVYDWYFQDDTAIYTDCNMQMVCDIYNYKSVTATTANTEMPPLLNCESLSVVTLENLRVVVDFCSNLVCKVEPAVLERVFEMDTCQVKYLAIIYNTLLKTSAVEQQNILASINRRKMHFVKLHRGSCEMEKCLRMYVYLCHLQDPEYVARLLSHLTLTHVFCVQDDARILFASWICRKRSLAERDSILSSAIIKFGGQDLADFCLRSNSYLRELQPVVHEIVVTEFDDDVAEHTSYLLDPDLFKEVFDENELAGTFMYVDT